MIGARSICARAGGRYLLRDVSCEVAPGEVLGIIGPNAAGKSTLLSILGGERAPASGEVSLLGKPLAAWSPPALARVRAVVRQRSEVAFDLRVLDVVLLGRFAHAGRGDSADDSRAAHRALDEVGLADVAERPYAHLSGGEQRRVQIARALAQVSGDGPRFLLLDEPLANLDLHHQLDTLALLRRKAKGGLGIAVVLHELTLSARACDRLLVLADGRTARAGPPAEVLTPGLLASVFRVEALVRVDSRAGLVIDLVRPVAGPSATKEGIWI